MAFGRNVEAIQADVAFNVDLGKFRADLGGAERAYKQTVGGMSSDAIRLSVAQEKVARAIKRTGPESLSTKQATLGLRREMDSLANSSAKAERNIDRDTRSLDRFSRGAVAGSGVFRGLGRSIAFASGSFLGGVGFVYALRQVIGVASQVQEETEKTGVVFGKSADEVQSWAKTLALSFGVAEGAALEAAGRFGNMLRPLGFGEQASAAMSKRLVELAADMASFNNTKPDIVLKALASGLAGQVRPLRAYGVTLTQLRLEEEAYATGIADKGAKLTTAQKVQAAYNLILKDTSLQHGDVARNTESLSVAESKLNAELQNNERNIGRGLLPAITDLTNKTAVWLGDTENQARIQRDVNAVIKDGTKIVKGLAGGFNTVRGAVDPLIAALGGLENAAQLAFIVGIVLKARKAAISFGLISAASGVTRTKVIADAEAIDAALDIATRPRVVPITTTGAPGVPGTPGVPPVTPVPIPKSGFLGRFGGALTKVAGAATYGFAVGGMGVAQVEGKIIKDRGRYYISDGRGNRSEISEATAKEYGYKVPSRGLGLPKNKDRSSGGPIADVYAAGAEREKRGGGARGDGLSALQRLQLAEIRPGDDLADSRALLAYYQRIVDNGKLTDDKLFQAKQDLLQQQAKVISIQEGITKDAQTARDKRTAEIEKQRDDAAKGYRTRLDIKEQRLTNGVDQAETTRTLSDDRKRSQALIAFYRAESHDTRLLAVERLAYEKKLVDARKERRDKAETGYRTRLDVREQRLENAVEKAGLDETLTNDRKRTQELAAFYRAKTNDKHLRAAERLAYEKKLIDTQAKIKDIDSKKDPKAEEPLTRAEMRGLIGDALTAQAGIQEKYAPNFQTHVLEHLTREQTSVLRDVAAESQFRDAPVIRRDTEALFG